MKEKNVKDEARQLIYFLDIMIIITKTVVIMIIYYYYYYYLIFFFSISFHFSFKIQQ